MDLCGQLLVAMPGMSDLRFERSVILVCAHSAEGSMGLIVNKPVKDLSFSGLLEKLDLPKPRKGRDILVHFGGPVERGRGFVLHSRDYSNGPATVSIGEGPGGIDLGMTATLDALEAVASGEGPLNALLALGYSGWGPGQLESEIGRNDWLTGTGDSGLIFGRNDGAKWASALRGMGIDPVTLSGTAGRA
jgi:putative transcriptional regulator